MVANIFEVISSAVTQFGQTLVSGVTALTQLVYDTSGSTPQLTFVGTMLLIAVGMSYALIISNGNIATSKIGKTYDFLNYGNTELTYQISQG